MRTAFGLGLAALILAATTGCKGEPKLDGTYLMTAMEARGKAAPAEEVEKASETDRTIKIEGNKIIASKGGKEDVVTFTTDPSKKPKEITITETKPSGKTETMYGIYRLDGDTLTICMTESEKDRPKDFKTSAEDKAMMLTLKKKK